MSEFFIKRPIFAIVLSILLIILGIISLLGTPISKYPDITPPMVQITASYTGANAVNVEESVSTPIEQKVNGVENMIYMQSTNAGNGSMTLKVSFEVGTDLDNANMLTQNRVTQANATLPQEVTRLGINTKKSLTFPLVMFSIYSPNGTYDNAFINNYAYINLVNVLKRINGVGDVSVMGGSEYSMRIWLKPDRMAQLNLSVDDVTAALKARNAIVPGGKFGSGPNKPNTSNTYIVQLQNRLVDAEEFGNIIIKSNENGAVVRLKDIGRVELGVEDYNILSRMEQKPSAFIAVYQTPGSNGVEVATKARAEMEKLSESFVDDLTYKVALDTTDAIHASIEEILHTLFEAVILVILVVFIFLQDWRATLIPLITVPVSLLGTFILFPMLGFSVNVLSLLGLVLAIGLVVDDAIVVVEAVMYHIEHGLSPKEATRKAMKEVSGALIGVAVILAAVFIPVALSGGITGRLYQQFAITIAISVLFSAFNALTLSPALAAILLKPKDENAKKSWLDKFFDKFNELFEKLTHGYMGLVNISIRRLKLTVVILISITIFALLLGKYIPTGFVPEEDEGYFMTMIQLPDAASLERTMAVTKKVEKILAQYPEIETYTLINGFNIISGTQSTNAATAFVALKNWKDRDKSVARIIKEMNFIMAQKITDGTVMNVAPPPIPGLGTSAGFSFMLQDKGGHSPEYLQQQAYKFIAEAKKRPEIGNIYTLYRAQTPQKKIEVDVEKVEKMGLDLNSVNTTISALLGGSYVNNFNSFGQQYKTYIQADVDYRMRPEALSQFFIKDRRTGNMVPINTLVRVYDTTGPDYTTRYNLYRAAEMSGAPAEGYSSAQAMQAIEEVAKATLPQTMGYEWANMSYQEKQSEGKSSSAFAMAIVFVFLILAAMYESWKLPMSVLLGTPWALMGGLLGLFIAGFIGVGFINNIFAQIGLVMLIGLNAKNAILIIEYAKQRKDEHGMSVVDAAKESAMLRFRPILMTSFAFILGVTPLITASGSGAEARKVMGVTVFSGMLVATILGIILIPAFYVLIENKKEKKKAKAKTAKGE